MRAVVVGGGTMGAGIAAALAGAGSVVDLVDEGEAESARAVDRARAAIAESARRESLAGQMAEIASEHVRTKSSISACAPRPELVIEAVPERLELKRRVLAAAEALQPRLLATNTSGIAIEELALSLRQPERFLGLHFFNPVSAMALVEVVIGASTAAESRVLALDIVARLGKEAVVVKAPPALPPVASASPLPWRRSACSRTALDFPRFDGHLMACVGKLGRKAGHGFYRWTPPDMREAPSPSLFKSSSARGQV